MSFTSKFGIPAAQALILSGTVAGTVGCAPDPMFGEWSATSFTSDGTRYTMPLIEEYAYGTLRVEISMEFEDLGGGEGKGEFAQVSSYADENVQYAYDLEGTRSAKGVWEIEINDENDIELTCTATDDDLECDGEDVTGVRVEVEFERN